MDSACVRDLIGALPPPFFPRPGLFPEVVHLAAAFILSRTLQFPGNDYWSLGRRLVELESLRIPSFVRGGNLAQRAFVLLELPLGLRMEDHLEQYFTQFGHVESCVAYTTKEAALVIFSTQDAAARALRGSLAQKHGHPAPRDDQVVDYLRLLRHTLLRFTRQVLHSMGVMAEAGPLAYEDALPQDIANDVLPPGTGA